MPKAKDKRKRINNVSTSDSSKNDNGLQDIQALDNIKFHEKRVQKLGPSTNFSTGEKISKSKLLLTKERNKTISIDKNKHPRVCGNGKPMPSLAELEKMYEDSDEETNEPKKSDLTKKMPVSPRSLKELASKMIDCIDDSLNSSVPQNIYPTKKRKRNGDPYIVGCQEREQYLGKTKTKFGIGDTKYEVDKNNMEVSSGPVKRRKKTHHKQPSTSTFIANTDEMLKESDNTENHSDGSTDSNQTLTYDIDAISPLRKRPITFSPIPSTSKDNEIFLKNDMKFNESLMCEDSIDDDDDIEVIEIPCETILVDDEGSNDIVALNNCIQMGDSDVEEVSYSYQPNYNIPAVGLDFYSSFDLNYIQNNENNEVIDVDDVINETKTVLKKCKSKRGTKQVTWMNKNYIHENDVIRIDQEHTTENKIAEVVRNFFDQWTPENRNDIKSEEFNSDVINIEDENINSTGTQSLINKIMSYFFKTAKNVINNLGYSKNLESSVNTDYFSQVSVNEDFSTPILSPSSSDNSIIEISDSTCTDTSNMVNDSVIYVSTSKPAKNKCYRTQQSRETNMSSIVIDSPSPEESIITRNYGECPICMENFSKTTMVSTMCGHVFCLNCIENAILSNGKKCPNCRKPLRGKQAYHKIYL